MRYLSVCSGIEAASAAWHDLDWTPLAFSEIEPFSRAVLAHRFPGVPLHGDFTVLRDQPWIVDADILVGGTPCQAFSVAGPYCELFAPAGQTINHDSMEGGYRIRKIDPRDTRDLILNVHYARRMPPISYAFGLFLDGALEGVCTFGQPASPRICDGFAGKKWKRIVIELNRLVLRHNRKNEASRLVGAALRLLPRPMIVISYADTAQNHLGIIYQATNWRYYGLSEIRTDRVFIDGTPTKHGRHMTSTDMENLHERTKLVSRPRKHRYVQVLADKLTSRQIDADIRYELKPYPTRRPT